MANAAHTLTLAEQHGARSLKVAALRFVAANAVAVLKTDGWAHLSDALKDEVRTICKALRVLWASCPC